MLFAERWRHLTYSNEPNFINNALLVAKEYFYFKLSNVTKRATVACAQCALRTAVLACSQCASRTEAPSNGLRKYHRRERTNERTNPHSHVDFLNLIINVKCISVRIIRVCDNIKVCKVIKLSYPIGFTLYVVKETWWCWTLQLATGCTTCSVTSKNNPSIKRKKKKKKALHFTLTIRPDLNIPKPTELFPPFHIIRY